MEAKQDLIMKKKNKKKGATIRVKGKDNKRMQTLKKQQLETSWG